MFIHGHKRGFLTAGLVGIVFVFLFFGGLFAGSHPTYYLLPTTYSAHAAQLDLGINQVDQSVALPSADIRVIVGRIIRVVLSLLGIVALLLVLWGGFQWMSANGEEEKILDAKRNLINSAIGLAIIVSAWSITTFVLNAILNATTGRTPGASEITGAPPASLFCDTCNELGRGIDMHYPPRDAENVPRNADIIVTFKRPIRRDTVIVGWTDNNTSDNPADDPHDLNVANIKIYKLNLQANDRGAASAFTASQVKVSYTPDHRTFIFDTPDLDSPSERVLYEVWISDGVHREDNASVLSEPYRWQFRTSTALDFTPPVVTSLYPAPAGGAPRLPRNLLARVTFNEAINPITASTIEVRNRAGLAGGGTAPLIAGEWRITNQYRTLEFVPSEQCGQNACGEAIFCLPANGDVAAIIPTATLRDPSGTDSIALKPANGITDVAGNALNDQGNDARGGQSNDSVPFAFGVSAQLDLEGPRIVSVTPNINEPNIDPAASVELVSSEPLSFSSVNTDNVRLAPRPAHNFWFTLRATDLNARGTSVEAAPVVDVAGRTAVASRINADHALFFKAPFGRAPQLYSSQVTVGLRDTFQNCFAPSAGPGPSCAAANLTPTAPYCCNGAASADHTCGGITSF